MPGSPVLRWWTLVSFRALFWVPSSPAYMCRETCNKQCYTEEPEKQSKLDGAILLLSATANLPRKSPPSSYLSQRLFFFSYSFDTVKYWKKMQNTYIYTHIFIGFGANNKIYKQKPRTFAVLPRLKNTEIYHHIPLSWSLCDKQNGKIIGMPIWYLTVYIYQKALWVDQKRIL